MCTNTNCSVKFAAAILPVLSVSVSPATETLEQIVQLLATLVRLALQLDGNFVCSAW